MNWWKTTLISMIPGNSKTSSSKNDLLIHVYNFLHLITYTASFSQSENDKPSLLSVSVLKI
jgi:hypothetical protein